ncbi:MAG TPA: glycine--tRNA ligase subunit beta [Gammaproteobacteria bacterium]|nr:glycine--tRNA ligase subunit beta [Gammaproteobacteria bacterium]
MTATRDLLLEIGTEELPPKSLRRMRDALRAAVDSLLDEYHLPHGASQAFATPRRLAVLVHDVDVQQPDRAITRRGPALKAAFDADGKPTKPAEGFARSCGVEVSALERLETDKGAWLVWNTTETGRPTAELLGELVDKALRAIPVARRMRWGDSDFEFVRPVHWVLLMLGSEPVTANILGQTSDRYTRGHRFHHNKPIAIDRPADYLDILEHTGRVMADMDRRRDSILTQVTEAGAALHGVARIDADLLDEVTALVEWPVAISGAFDPRFLDVPAEALVSSMQDHQKFFPVTGPDHALLPCFITVANIASKEPDQVRAGNERVIRPRLEDAAFFWTQDRKQSLASRIGQLDSVTFQQQLGTLGDKQRRIAVLAGYIAGKLQFDIDQAQRAATLCKCDLVTSMVFEFPDLQGTMGRYYALHDGEDAAVAAALDEQYQPRHAGDGLPASAIGQTLAIAERLDTLVGIFAIGQTPSGDKDPFGLRRAALGMMRIIIECRLDLDLRALLERAADNFPDALNAGAVGNDLFAFMMERLRNWYTDTGCDILVFDAVLARQPVRPLDFDARIQAVRTFQGLPEAASLAAANKRIRNILRKCETAIPHSYRQELLTETAEQALAAALDERTAVVEPLFEARDYNRALCELAGLQAPVDRFFDDVMVMTDDPALRDNRLALLNTLSELFLQVADISLLQT